MAKKVSITMSLDLNILSKSNDRAETQNMNFHRFTEAALDALIIRLDTGEWPDDVEQLLDR